MMLTSTYFDQMLRSFPLDEQPAWPTRLQHPGGDSQRHVWGLKRACYAQAARTGFAVCLHCHRLANGASRTSTRREAAKKPPEIDPHRVWIQNHCHIESTLKPHCFSTPGQQEANRVSYGMSRCVVAFLTAFAAFGHLRYGYGMLWLGFALSNVISVRPDAQSEDA